MKKLILSAFILYLPFQLKLPEIFGFNLINAFLILLLLILLSGWKHNHNTIKPAFETPLIILLLIWIASFFHTIFFTSELWQLEITREFKRLFSLVLVYFVFSRSIKTKKDFNFYFSLFLITLVLVGLSTWKQGMLAGPNFADFKRSPGPFGLDYMASDIAGGFLGTFIPFLLSYSLFVKKQWAQFLGFTGFGICLFGLLATYSRGSMMALVLSTVVIILLAIAKRSKLTNFSSMVIIFILIAGIVNWKLWVPKATLSRIEKTVITDDFHGEASLDKGSDRRLEIWRSGIGLFKTNPVFGVGFKRTEYLLGVDPHNSFILIAAEMGIFGLLAFLFFLSGIYKEACRLLKSEFFTVGIGYIGFIVAFIIINIFYANFFRDTVVGSFWIILGLLAAAKKISNLQTKVV